MTAITQQLTNINTLFQGVYSESLHASDFVNHVHKFFVQELKGLSAKFFRTRQMLNTMLMKTEHSFKRLGCRMFRWWYRRSYY